MIIELLEEAVCAGAREDVPVGLQHGSTVAPPWTGGVQSVARCALRVVAGSAGPVPSVADVHVGCDLHDAADVVNRFRTGVAAISGRGTATPSKLGARRFHAPR